MKKQPFLVICAFWAHSLVAWAQESPPKKLSWDASSNLMWVTSKNTCLPTLMLKRSIAHDQAIRLRLGISLYDRDDLDPFGNNTSSSKLLKRSTDYLVLIGYERRNALSKHFRFIYGSDLSYRYFHTNEPRVVPFAYWGDDPNSVKFAIENKEIFTVTEFYTKTYTLSVFGGLQYFPLQKLSFSLESAFTGSLLRTRQIEPLQSSPALYNINIKRLSLLPLSTLNVHFHF